MGDVRKGTAYRGRGKAVLWAVIVASGLAACGLRPEGPAPEPGPAAETAAAPDVTTGAMNEQAAPQPDRPGFLSGLFGGRGGDAPVGSGRPVADLPFGEMARVCGLNKRVMGTEVARSPGRNGYRLYDTNPSSVDPRMQFITGFKDGCARQFTAALALFGSAQVHEATRYNMLNTTPYSETDTAYETLKMRVCRVDRGVFCPERRLKRMDREAVFLSVYRDFGGSGHWMEVFLHNGRVAGTSLIGG